MRMEGRTGVRLGWVGLGLDSRRYVVPLKAFDQGDVV